MERQQQPAALLTPKPRYTMQDATNIRKTAMRVLIDARLKAMAKVSDDMLSLAGATAQELANKLPDLLAGVLPQQLTDAAQHDQWERVRLRLSVATFAHMVSMQLAEGVTVAGVAEVAGINLEEFAEEAWQGFEGRCVEIIKGAASNV